MRKIENIGRMVGNTPLAEIILNYKGEKKTIFAKLECVNFSGSVKDRIGYYILKEAYKKGTIKPGDTIAEATSGNTGIAFCAMGAYLGHKVIIYMPDWMSEERKKLMRAYGAEIRLVSKEEGGFLGSIAMAENFAKENEHVFLPRQFENEDNTLGQYYGLGMEIVEKLDELGLVCGGFVAGVGTGGSVMGVARAIREKNPAAKAFPLEPAESPTLSTGYKVGVHRIAGISDEFIPDLVKLDQLDEIVAVSDADSLIMAQKLAKVGLAVGISSGANLIGAIKQLDKVENTMVTVFADDNKKYLSTDLAKEIEPREGFISTDVEILDVILH